MYMFVIRLAGGLSDANHLQQTLTLYINN